MSETGEKMALVPKLRFPEFANHGAPIVELRKIAQCVSDSVPLSQVNPASYVSTESLLPEFGGFERPAGLPTVTSVRSFRRNDVLVSNIRPYLKKVWYADRDGGASNDVLVFRSNGAASPDYLAHVIRSGRFIGHMMKSAKGVKMPRGDADDALAFRVMCPSDAEQRKIAECLQSLDELISAETEKLEALKLHKKGLLQQLFPAEGETTPRLRFPQFRNAGEWKTTTLKSVAFISSGTTPSRTNTAFFANGTIPWVKTMDLNNSEIHHTGEMVTEDSGVKINPPGSVLVAMYGGFNQIGRTGILKKPSATNQAIAVLRPKTGEVTSGYLLLWLNAKVDVWKRVAASSRKDANITSNDVANFDISVPVLEAEQTEITIALDAVEGILAGSERSLQKLRAHKAALMQQLFPSLDEM